MLRPPPTGMTCVLISTTGRLPAGLTLPLGQRPGWSQRAPSPRRRMGIVQEQLLPIGQFSARCRLSIKALRLYDRLGLVVPVRIDPVTGYRWYSPGQVDRARLVGLLRRLDMPLARIAEVTSLAGPQAAAAVRAHVSEARRAVQERAELAGYICLLLDDSDRSNQMDKYEVQVRTVPARAV